MGRRHGPREDFGSCSPPTRSIVPCSDAERSALSPRAAVCGAAATRGGAQCLPSMCSSWGRGSLFAALTAVLCRACCAAHAQQLGRETAMRSLARRRAALPAWHAQHAQQPGQNEIILPSLTAPLTLCRNSMYLPPMKSGGTKRRSAFDPRRGHPLPKGPRRARSVATAHAAAASAPPSLVELTRRAGRRCTPAAPSPSLPPRPARGPMPPYPHAGGDAAAAAPQPPSRPATARITLPASHAGGHDVAADRGAGAAGGDLQGQRVARGPPVVRHNLEPQRAPICSR